MELLYGNKLSSKKFENMIREYSNEVSNFKIINKIIEAAIRNIKLIY